MAIKIIKQREHVERTTYDLLFEDNLHPGSGYGFPCTKEGKLIESEITPLGLDNYYFCMQHIGTMYHQPEIREFTNRYVEPAIAECTCGEHVSLADPLTNYCGCGRAYNMSGQEVCPELAEEPWDDDDDATGTP